MSGLLASVLEDGGEELERSLRPGTLEDFVGQERVKEQLAIALGAEPEFRFAVGHAVAVGVAPAADAAVAVHDEVVAVEIHSVRAGAAGFHEERGLVGLPVAVGVFLAWIRDRLTVVAGVPEPGTVCDHSARRRDLEG